MTTTNLIQTLRAEGIAKGLCRPWQKKFTGNLSVQELITMYVHGIDFCINNNYPSLEFLRREFKGKGEPYGLFIDEPDIFLRNNKSVVLNGSCRATLNYDGYTVSRLYLRHDSKANINIMGNAIVTIDAFDDTKLSITAGGDSKVIVHLRGKADGEIIKKGIRANIKIIKTSANTY